jgi:two-component system, LuxR family, sensor kinase FixL
MAKSIDTFHVPGQDVAEPAPLQSDRGRDLVKGAFRDPHDALRAAKRTDSSHLLDQHMALASEAANMGFWIRDFDREEFWASDQWRALFGFTSSETLNIEKFVQRLHPNDRETTRQALEDAYTGDGTYQTEHSVLLPDGQVRWISCHGRIELGNDERPLRLLGVSLDITRRKLAELEAQAHRNEAAHLLRVASLGELSSSLAHELRQPLTAILSNVEVVQVLLARDNFDLQEVRGILNDIVADDSRAADIINQLHVLIKRGEYNSQPVEANQLIRDVLHLMNQELTARSVRIVTDLTTDAALWVSGDRVQLQQVLLNLVLNAADSMSQSKGNERTLTIRSRRMEDKNVQLSVTDTGHGIPPGDEEAIFDSYYTTKPEGLGLGLSLSRSIVAAHGGHLWAESHGSNGATLHCTIPECMPCLTDAPAAKSTPS